MRTLPELLELARTAAAKSIAGDIEEVVPEQKFLRQSRRAVCSKAHKAKMEKIMGKRRIQADPFYSKQIVTYMPDFASGRAALNHLCRVSESIQIGEKHDGQ